MAVLIPELGQLSARRYGDRVWLAVGLPGRGGQRVRTLAAVRLWSASRLANPLAPADRSRQAVARP